MIQITSSDSFDIVTRALEDMKAEQGDKFNLENVNLAELLVEKNRHGPTGKIQLAWNPTYTMYTGIAKREGNE